jgi:hypothetical protein
MTTQKYWLAIAAAMATALAGCSSLLGLNKEPSLADDTPIIDAAIDQMTIDMSTIDMDTSACAGMDCGVFGCDTANHVCRPAKLWVFLTDGLFAANAFGGTDNTVRATADGKCFMTASSTDFANRACSQDRTHAILTVSSSDPIGSMATLYHIPTTAEVHRIDDDVLVFNNWPDLVGTQAPKAFFSSAARAPTDADGIGWTGFGGPTASNCAGWTSNTSSTFGVIAHTTSTKGSQATWLGPESVACNTGPLQHLLCVCWSGGN